jgi:hypothetical protein
MMTRSAYIHGFICLLFVLSAYVNVAHAYEHEDGKHVFEECEICFLISLHAADGLIDELHKNSIINHDYIVIHQTRRPGRVTRPYKLSRAPPAELISITS